MKFLILIGCLLGLYSLIGANPLKFMGKCLSDHECKTNEFCDHTGINPFGSCKVGKEVKESCILDRYCKSKHCHLMRCVPRKPVKDGPCSKDQHDECIATQYCSHKENIYKCRDRNCTGACIKDAHCLSNKCSFFMCKKPTEGCSKNATAKSIVAPTPKPPK